MTVAFFLWYALYVLLSAYARGFMSVKLFGNINVALVLGLLQFVTTFLIAWYYARFAAAQGRPDSPTRSRPSWKPEGWRSRWSRTSSPRRRPPRPPAR